MLAILAVVAIAPPVAAAKKKPLPGWGPTSQGGTSTTSSRTAGWRGRSSRFLVWTDAEGIAFGAPLSTRKLIHSERKRFKTSAHGFGPARDDTGVTARTEVSWTMSLKRIQKSQK